MHKFCYFIFIFSFLDDCIQAERLAERLEEESTVETEVEDIMASNNNNSQKRKIMYDFYYFNFVTAQ